MYGSSGVPTLTRAVFTNRERLTRLIWTPGPHPVARPDGQGLGGGKRMIGDVQREALQEALRGTRRGLSVLEEEDDSFVSRALSSIEEGLLLALGCPSARPPRQRFSSQPREEGETTPLG